MDFKKYSSIENSYRSKYVDKIRTYFPGETFIVQEKIHGCNFSFYTDGKEVLAAKRTTMLSEDEMVGFYHSDQIYDRYKEQILGIFDSIKEHVNGSVGEIVVVGELCGGNYPHPDVEKNNTVKGIQSGVYYSNNIEFVIFDIKVNGSYVSVPAVNTVCTLNGMPFAGVLFEGKLDDCLSYNNEFSTTISGMFDLPRIEGNICEGTVIRTKNALYCPNGERLLLKNKNNAFVEKNGSGKVKTAKVHTPFPEHLVGFRDEIELYATENRLRNVLSKTGIPEEKSKVFGTLIKEFNHDIILEFIKENEGFNELSKSDRKLITSKSNQFAGAVIRGNLDNIVDGTF